MVSTFFRFGQTHKTVIVSTFVNNQFRVFAFFRFSTLSFLVSTKMKLLRCFFLLARINHLLFPKSRFVFHPKNGGVIMAFLLLSR